MAETGHATTTTAAATTESATVGTRSTDESRFGLAILEKKTSN
jgi:hypothetical protein